MEKPILNDPQILPDKEVLKNTLGGSYFAYEELMKIISSSEFGIETEWNYYKDGNSWLCKAIFKKKTVFWLSVWDKYFKTGFYFTEKTCAGIENLKIDEKIKEDFGNNKSVGKLMPLSMCIFNKEQLPDLLEIIAYKKSLK